MNITLEQIDLLRQRANVSYQDAKEALEKCNNDLVDALVYLEKNNKVKNVCEKSNSFWDSLKRIIKKGNNTKFIISKNNNTVLSISVTISILLAIFATPLVIIGLIVALFTNHRFRFEKQDGCDLKINKVLNKVSDSVEDIKKSVSEENLKEE